MIKVYFAFRAQFIKSIETELKIIPRKNELMTFDELKDIHGNFVYDAFKVKELQYNFDAENKIESLQITLKKLK
jgi:hypothetical protein